MKIIRNYILKDFFTSLIFSFLFITLVMVLGNLVKLSDMVIRKGVSVIEAFKIFLFLTPYLISFILPLSLLLGTLLSLGRLASDNEIIALKVSGVSSLKILQFFIIVGIIFSLGLFILNDKIFPHFHYLYRKEAKNLKTKGIISFIEPGVFLENFGNFILHIEDVNGNKLKNIFIYMIQGGKLSEVTFAKVGEFIIEEKKLKMKLEDGFQDRINPKNPQEFYRLNFKVFFMELPITKRPEKVDKKPQDLTFREIKKKIKHLKSLGIEPKDLILNLHKRISLSFSPLIFVILGFGIALNLKPRTKSVNFGIAFFCAGFFYLFLILAETFSQLANLPAFIGMWFPN
ncbi:MAG: hypothetical protein DRP76_04810, partial [Candidatus Omnitrophota bacterium]